MFSKFQVQSSKPQFPHHATYCIYWFCNSLGQTIKARSLIFQNWDENMVFTPFFIQTFHWGMHTLDFINQTTSNHLWEIWNGQIPSKCETLYGATREDSHGFASHFKRKESCGHWKLLQDVEPSSRCCDISLRGEKGLWGYRETNHLGVCNICQKISWLSIKQLSW